GGVGPTHDDVTMAGIARGFGTTVMREPVLEERVRAYWGAKLAPPHLRLAEVPAGAELVYGRDQGWPVGPDRNRYNPPRGAALVRGRFIATGDRFRDEPMTVARAYLDADEGQIAGDLDAVVAAFPAVRIGSYPRFTERDFKVLITFEGLGAGEVAGALAML